MNHSLTLGDLLLTDDLPSDDGYRLNVLADGASFGVAQSVQEVVTSLLADGDIVRTTRYGNREVTFSVEITGDSLVSVQAGEVALRREIGKGNLLAWEAPDVVPVPTVFEVVDSSMEQVFNDLDELKRRRIFRVSLTCAPWARSLDPVTVSAIAGGATTPTLVDACNSTTGWTSTYIDTVITSAGGAVISTRSKPMTDMVRTGSIVMSSTHYLLLEHTGILNVLFINGVTVPVTVARTLTNGRTLSVFETSGATITSFRALTKVDGLLSIFEVSKSATLPQVSPRQVARVIAVGGTERTPASIRVKSANGTDKLGLTIVHTSPEDGSGYSPPLRRWRTSGNTVTADSTAVSGAREPLHPNAVVAQVPTSSLPEGGYLLCAYIRVGVAGTYSVFFSGVTLLPPPNASVGLGPVVNQVRLTFPVAHTWVLVPLGLMSLPTVRTSAGKVVVSIQRANTESVDMLIDEAWLFRVDDDCALTIGDIAATNLWIDSPDVNSPVPTYWMGDSMDARAHPGPSLRPGNHTLSPDGTATFAATLGTEYPEVSGTFFRRWHSNAAE